MKKLLFLSLVLIYVLSSHAQSNPTEVLSDNEFREYLEYSQSLLDKRGSDRLEKEEVVKILTEDAKCKELVSSIQSRYPMLKECRDNDFLRELGIGVLEIKNPVLQSSSGTNPENDLVKCLEAAETAVSWLSPFVGVAGAAMLTDILINRCIDQYDQATAED